MPRASSLGDFITEKFNTDVELIAGSGGVFEIEADGKLIFSKKASGRFPEADEIVALLDKEFRH